MNSLKNSLSMWKSPAYRGFVLLSGILMLAFLGLNIINQRFQMSDLRVYHEALLWWIDGQSPYGRSFGLSSGFYKYSLTAALFFTPLTWLSWGTAKVLYYLAIAGSIMYFLPKMVEKTRKLFFFQPRRTVMVIVISLIFIGGHFSRELLLGNINWFLLLLVVLVFALMENKLSYLAGAFFAIALIFKPHFVLLLPWMVLRGEWKALISTFVTVGLLLILPAVGIGWEANQHMLGEWLMSMQAHNVRLEESPNTMYAWLNAWTHYMGMPGWAAVVMVLMFIGPLFALFMLKHQIKEKALPLAKGHRYLEYFGLVGLIPNFVHTDTEHFLWSVPMLFILVWYLVQEGRRSRAWWILVVVMLMPYGWATPDIWGAKGAEWLQISGVLGMANVMIVLLGWTGGHRQLRICNLPR
jgi:hypothetical protein